MLAFLITRGNLNVRVYPTKVGAVKDKTDKDVLIGSEAELKASELPNGTLGAVMQQLSGQTFTRFSDRGSAARRTWKAMTDWAATQNVEPGNDEPEPQKGKEPKAPKEPKANKGRKSKVRDIPLEATRTTNPYRIGSKSHRTFDLILANPRKTFRELVALGGRANTIVGCIKDEYVRKIEPKKEDA